MFYYQQSTTGKGNERSRPRQAAEHGAFAIAFVAGPTDLSSHCLQSLTDFVLIMSAFEISQFD